MSNIINSGLFNIVFLVTILAAPVLLLVVWFFINRVSVRANEQIELLQAMLEHQKQQTALLLRLCKANELDSPTENPAESPADNDALLQLVAER